MIIDDPCPYHVPYCDYGSVNKAGNCIGGWRDCDKCIYRAGSTGPLENWVDVVIVSDSNRY